jgi:hypothetical protein
LKEAAAPMQGCFCLHRSFARLSPQPIKGFDLQEDLVGYDITFIIEISQAFLPEVELFANYVFNI